KITIKIKGGRISLPLTKARSPTKNGRLFSLLASQRPATVGFSGSGKTRTKDKYRVVYTDHQRLELEKEFQYNRYIIKRAKERKMTRKKLQHSQQASTTTPTPPVLGGHADAHAAPSLSSNMVSDIKSEEY
uniref:Homeobox domain-containing protein n=1 Tax=Oryzias latipes TaxID=8090 RepID=A0A3P9IMA6_ORYLA